MIFAHMRLHVTCAQQCTKLYTAKPAERQENLTILPGKTVRAPTVQISIGIFASSTDLQQSGSTIQGSLTALGPMLFSLTSANETIPLVSAIVYSEM